jgi:RNA polymerase sigma factor (sigma-70 family)
MPAPHTPSPSEFALLCKVIDAVARTSGLRESQAEDFSQWVHLRLLERNYDPLTRFAGRSTLQTYLTVVVRRLLLDWGNAEYGKWRPSRWAHRIGGAAIDLDRLLTRDGHPVDEAIAILQDRAGAPPPAALRELANRVPRRNRRRNVAYLESERPSNFEDPVQAEEASIARRKLLGLLKDAFRQLAPADRDLLRLRFVRNLPVVTIARLLGVPAKRLYARIDRVVLSMRPAVTEGFSAR